MILRMILIFVNTRSLLSMSVSKSRVEEASRPERLGSNVGVLAIETPVVQVAAVILQHVRERHSSYPWRETVIQSSSRRTYGRTSCVIVGDTPLDGRDHPRMMVRVEKEGARWLPIKLAKR
jgi:hypothetical protein